MGTKNTILVVEDDPSQRRSITDLLEQEGFTAVACSTGEEGLRALQDEQFDAAVVDLRLPDTDGTRLARSMLAVDPALRIIVNSAHGTFESARDLLNLGAHGFVEKAGDPAEFLRCVHGAVNARIRAYASDLEQAVAARTAELEASNRSLREEIARRELIELERQNSERRYQALFQSAPSCIHEIDRDGKILAMNEAGLRMLGLTHEEQIRGVRYLDLIGEADREVVAACLQEALAGRGGSFGFKLGEGESTRYFRSRVEPYREGPSANTLIIGQTEEVTEAVVAQARQDELERQLRHAQKLEAVGTLASGVAHEFNNVLTAILGYTELLEHAGESESVAEEAVQGIRQAADQAVEVTRALLTFSGKSSERKRPFDLGQLLLGSVRLLKRMLPDSVQVAEDLNVHGRVMVCGDKSQISQVLMNLAVNARDAMPDGGRLVVGLELEEREDVEYAVVRMADQGHGMSEETRQRIFEPFFSTKAREQGTGLGLAIVHGIVTDHGGQLEVDSEPGAGTTIRLLLPLHDTEAEEEPGPSPTEKRTSGHGERVLVVEDDIGVRRLVRQVLTAAGYEISEAGDGLEGLMRFEAESIDLVLLDQDMPRMNGSDCLSKLRVQSPELPAVLMSGLRRFSAESEDQNMRVLRKPFRVDELLENVADLLKTKPLAHP